MKLHIDKKWIQKFDKNESESTTPIGPQVKLCGCGNPVTQDSDFCDECIDGYRGEDEP